MVTSASLLNRKRQMPDVTKNYKGKLNLSWKGKVWMDNDLTEDYLRCTFGPAFFNRRLLVWDFFRCHISEGTKKILKELEIDTAVVPSGCTKFIQAPDVSWKQPFKAKLKQLFDDWMANGKWREVSYKRRKSSSTFSLCLFGLDCRRLGKRFSRDSCAFFQLFVGYSKVLTYNIFFSGRWIWRRSNSLFQGEWLGSRRICSIAASAK
jgi:hypothetical protein